MKRIILMLTAFLPLLGFGADLLTVDPCVSIQNWHLNPGSEFKGGRSSLNVQNGGLHYQYDYSHGGAYSEISVSGIRLRTAKEIIADLKTSGMTHFTYRVTDHSGRTFEGTYRTASFPKKTKVAFNLTGPWTKAWGGDATHSSPEYPLQAFSIVTDRSKGVPDAGNIFLYGLYAEEKAADETIFNATGFERQLGGWTIRGEWVTLLAGTALKLTATPNTDRDLDLSVAFPQPGRDARWYWHASASQGIQVNYWRPEFVAGINPRNVYTAHLTLAAENRERMELPLLLMPLHPIPTNLGAPKLSKDIRNGKTGTCVHFAYVSDVRTGPFAGWYKKEFLLDQIAQCGFKYVRDGIGVTDNPDGTFELNPEDIRWAKLAKSRGINLIIVVPMTSDEPVEKLVKRVEFLAAHASEFGNIFELGNEPSNFGNWIKNFGGTWNGYEKPDKVSKWVQEFLKYSNAAADAIRRVNPNATIIGIGSNSSTNFHMLNLGVSKNFDGIVDHAYPMSMTPEMVPWGTRFIERDGIAVGDTEFTFRGLMESYGKKFRETGKERKVWITEFGFSTFWYNGKSEEGMFSNVTEEAQAAYLLRRMIESIALPMVAVSCQYDFLDDYYSGAHDQESNFGLLRGDYSRKPSYYALQRMNSLLGDSAADPAKVTVTAMPLQRSAVRQTIVSDWDNARIMATNGIRTYAFTNPEEEKMLAVWSMQPYSKEANNRVISLEIDGWKEFDAPPIVINLMNGDTCDLPVKRENGKILIENLELKEAPLLIKFFRNSR